MLDRVRIGTLREAGHTLKEIAAAVGVGQRSVWQGLGGPSDRGLLHPLAETDPERVAAITEWLVRHAKPAGLRADRPGSSGAKRKRRVAV